MTPEETQPCPADQATHLAAGLLRCTAAVQGGMRYVVVG